MAGKHHQQQRKKMDTPSQMVPSPLYRSSCKEREKKKLPSSHIRSVVLIETRCGVVKVCYCKLLSFMTLRRILKLLHGNVIRSMKYVALKPFVSVKDKAFRDTVQTPETFSIILSVYTDPPRSPYFLHIHQQNTELLQLFLYSRPCLVLKKKILIKCGINY